MEPLSALGAVSSIITFIDFATKLISTTNEIAQSRSGTSTDNLRAEEICRHLSALCVELERPAAWASSPSEPPDTAMLKKLCSQCREDCDELLDLIMSAKATGQNRLWSSLKAAVRSISFGQKKIEAIQKRLDRTQSTMTLYLTICLHNRVMELSSSVHTLSTQSRNLQSDQTLAIEAVTQSLASLTVETKRVQDGLSHNHQGTHFFTSQVQPVIDKLSGIAATERKLSREQSILASLDFERRPARREHIPEAYAETFKWALCSSSNLSAWLESSSSSNLGGKMFWISGKAGSGKSTLVKFLTEHPKTAELLQRWSGPKRTAIVEHYFWSPGTSMQKSWAGLMRSLLYGILSRAPSLIPAACPDRWAQFEMMKQAPRSSAMTDPWTTAEISKAFRAVAESPDLPVKICFFIDGIDEFEGDAHELCHLLRHLSSVSPDVKICISSRPLVLFEDTFGSSLSTKLYVHELTEPDIRRYCRGRLQSHSSSSSSKWRPDLQDETSPSRELAMETLVEDMVKKAEGVFLWVFLATQSLRSGLANGDSIEELQERLRILPGDLEKLFKSILDTVDPVYHQKMAGFLQLAIHAREPLRAELYWHCEKEFANPDYVRRCPVGITPLDTMARIRQHIGRLVNVRTKGLLEARGSRVEFLHRSVREFLLTADMTAYLAVRMSPRQDTVCSLVKAHVASIKTTTSDRVAVSRTGQGRFSGPFVQDIRDTMNYACRLLANDSSSFTETVGDLMNELEDATQVILSLPEFRHHIAGLDDPSLPFREELVQHGPASYLQEKLQERPLYLQGLRQQPLLTVMELDPPCLSKLRVLLEHGHNPNGDNYHSISPWLAFMQHLAKEQEQEEEEGKKKAGRTLRTVLSTDIIPLFLSHQANSEARMTCLSSSSSSTGRVQLTAFSWYLSLCMKDTLSESDDYIQVHAHYLRNLDVFLETFRPLTQTQTQAREREFGIRFFCEGIRSNPVLGFRRKSRLVYAVLSRLVRYLSATTTTTTTITTAATTTTTRSAVANADVVVAVVGGRINNSIEDTLIEAATANFSVAQVQRLFGEPLASSDDACATGKRKLEESECDQNIEAGWKRMRQVVT